MSRRPALITQAEIARAIRAAKQAGAATVEIRIREQASVVIRLDDESGAVEAKEIVL